MAERPWQRRAPPRGLHGGNRAILQPLFSPLAPRFSVTYRACERAGMTAKSPKSAVPIPFPTTHVMPRGVYRSDASGFLPILSLGRPAKVRPTRRAGKGVLTALIVQAMILR